MNKIKQTSDGSVPVEEIQEGRPFRITSGLPYSIGHIAMRCRHLSGNLIIHLDTGGWDHSVGVTGVPLDSVTLEWQK